jgi:hypothetical protein
MVKEKEQQHPLIRMEIEDGPSFTLSQNPDGTVTNGSKELARSIQQINNRRKQKKLKELNTPNSK